jgi:hypothetical protein
MRTQKGRTRWFRREERPIRHGMYECIVKISCSVPAMNWGLLEWDGIGFIVPVPMNVIFWRGMTQKACLANGGNHDQ